MPAELALLTADLDNASKMSLAQPTNMSDSEDNLSSAADIPADAEIEKCIRTVVREALKKGDEVTVNIARTQAEGKLGLDAGFFNDNAQWKQRSKELVTAAFDEPLSPEAPKKKATAPKAKSAPKAGTKRKSDESQPVVKKKQKKDQVSDSEADDGNDSEGDVDADMVSTRMSEQVPKSEDDSALSDPPEDTTEAKMSKENGKQDADDDESELSSVIDEPAPKKKRQKKAAPAKSSKFKAAKPKPTAKAKPPAEDNDESELSSVLDDPAPKKSRKKKSTSPKPTKAKPAGKDLSPDEEEIKRLQSWLLKCGIRKLWHRELAPYGSNKEKISHLKGMLDEVGMTGRFSAEKAKGIKEARELRAELEAATEFNKTWGHEKDGEGSGDEGGEDGGEERGVEEKSAAGKRARPKGFVDFGDSDEDSE